MSVRTGEEAPVWTNEDYKGRFLNWKLASRQAFERRNYHLRFSPLQELILQDTRALRAAFNASSRVLLDDELVRTSPTAPAGITRAKPKSSW